MTTATKTRRRKDPVLAKPRPTSIPTMAAEGLSAAEVLRALTNGQGGLTKILFPRAGGDYMVKLIRTPDMVTLTSEGRVDEPLSLALVDAAIPLADLGLRQTIHGEPTQWAVGVVIPLALSDRSEQVNLPNGSRSMVTMNAALQFPASADSVRIAISRLIEHGASLLTHAGDQIEGLWLLSTPLTVANARLLSAALAQKIEGAVKVAVDPGQRPMSGAWGVAGLAQAHYVSVEKPLLYHLPRAEALHRICPRQEVVTIGDVTSRVDPGSLV